MPTLALILARAGSKGLPDKNLLPVAGLPMVAWTIIHAQRARGIDEVVLSTDSPAIADVGRELGARIIDRPAHLATDTASVADAARHAVESLSTAFDPIVILYANVPVRPADLIDNAIDALRQSGGDSVQSVTPIGKGHPYWTRRLDAQHRLSAWQPNQVHRRQDLPPAYALDGGLIALRRRALVHGNGDPPHHPHAFLGDDPRGIITAPGSVIDIDTPADLAIAEAALQQSLRPLQGATLHLGGARGSRNDDAPPTSHRTHIIAELGVNHDGSLDRALELTDAARAAGADAVKVQVFNPDTLLSSQAKLAAYQGQPGTTVDEADVARNMLRKLQLNEPALQRIREAAHSAGLGFVATCFSLEDIPLLARLRVHAIKIASPDAVNFPLLAAAAELAGQSDIPLIVSTGACDEAELQRLRLWLWRCRGSHGRSTVVMHCVSAYPTPAGDAHLRWIDRMQGPACLLGYSDHTTDPHMGMLAAMRGAVVIEKHLTHDRSAPGPDHAASFDPQQFADYVALIRHAERALGPSGDRQALPIERDVRHVARQSVCARRDLPAGHVLTAADLTTRRPATGIPAEQLQTLTGSRLRRGVAAGHVVQWEDLEKTHEGNTTR